jgi:hypothetical protein
MHPPEAQRSARPGSALILTSPSRCGLATDAGAARRMARAPATLVSHRKSVLQLPATSGECYKSEPIRSLSRAAKVRGFWAARQSGRSGGSSGARGGRSRGYVS